MGAPFSERLRAKSRMVFVAYALHCMASNICRAKFHSQSDAREVVATSLREVAPQPVDAAYLLSGAFARTRDRHPAPAAICAGAGACCTANTPRRCCRPRLYRRLFAPPDARRCIAAAQQCAGADRGISVRRVNYSTWAGRSSSSGRAGNGRLGFSGVGVWA